MNMVLLLDFLFLNQPSVVNFVIITHNCPMQPEFNTLANTNTGTNTGAHFVTVKSPNS